MLLQKEMLIRITAKTIESEVGVAGIYPPFESFDKYTKESSIRFNETLLHTLSVTKALKKAFE